MIRFYLLFMRSICSNAKGNETLFKSLRNKGFELMMFWVVKNKLHPVIYS